MVGVKDIITVPSGWALQRPNNKCFFPD